MSFTLVAFLSYVEDWGTATRQLKPYADGWGLSKVGSTVGLSGKAILWIPSHISVFQSFLMCSQNYPKYLSSFSLLPGGISLAASIWEVRDLNIYKLNPIFTMAFLISAGPGVFQSTELWTILFCLHKKLKLPCPGRCLLSYIGWGREYEGQMASWFHSSSLPHFHPHSFLQMCLVPLIPKPFSGFSQAVSHLSLFPDYNYIFLVY